MSSREREICVCALDMGILNRDGVGVGVGVGLDSKSISQVVRMYVTANFAGVFGIGDGKSGFSDVGVRVGGGGSVICGSKQRFSHCGVKDKGIQGRARRREIE